MTELLPVVVVSTVIEQKGDRGDADHVTRWLREVLQHGITLLRQATVLLPWLVCLVLLSFDAGTRGAQEFFEEQALVSASLGVVVLLAATCLALLCGQLRGWPDARPLLALVVMVLWHLGFQMPHRDETERWCLAVLQAPSRDVAEGRVQMHHHAAVGLVLLDDMIRAVIRVLAREPAEAWPFAVASRKNYDLWIGDEEWWDACYHGANWQRLPAKPGFLCQGLPQPLPSSPRRLLREAMLFASMMAETLGMMVLLQPRCASASWTAAPCIASTLLVVSCSPWLPRQSDIVLVELSRLLSLVSRFSVYFQAILILTLGVFSQPRSPWLCPQEGSMLRMVEMGALVVLYIIVACRLLAVTARCRAASPLYAVPAEDVVTDHAPLRSSRPLYCGSLGCVAGSYAPTRLCEWEDLCSGSAMLPCSGLRARDRYVLRRCGELLVGREAHLLSHLDALNLRIEEADKEAKHSSFRDTEHQLQHAPVLIAMVLCLAVGASCGLGLSSHRVSGELTGDQRRAGTLEKVLWAFLLLRLGQSWYNVMIHNLRAHQAAGHNEVFEAAELRRQSSMLHRQLGQTQQMINSFEDRLQSLSIDVRRRQQVFCQDNPSGNWWSGAVGTIMMSWFGSLCAMVLFWPSRW